MKVKTFSLREHSSGDIIGSRSKGFPLPLGKSLSLSPKKTEDEEFGSWQK
jgi:hypothetical protein